MDNILVEIKGDLIAPKSNHPWKAEGVNYWLQFNDINGLTVEGGGKLHGNGKYYWKEICKDLRCPTGPTSLRFNGDTNLVVREITSINSRQTHISFNGCDNVRAEGLKIKAPGDSLNTDGIHIQSTNVLIRDTAVKTGDDCISIGGGASNIAIEKFKCGPGHGISVGSLGQSATPEIVRNVTVDGAVFKHTLNGVRIKTWQGGKGAASDFTFQNIKMIETNAPIIIDQFYCPHDSCKNKALGGAGVKISNVVFKNISGTSASEMAITLACSERVPCEGIKMENVKLSHRKKPAKGLCKNARGIAIGYVHPTLVCK